MPIDPSACHAAIREAEGLPPRPAPPILEFEPPPCSICGEATEYTDKAFRCEGCRCTWRRDTAHLYPGTWDDPTADQCPDTIAEQYGNGDIDEHYQCVLTAEHDGDHLHPGFGEWTDGGADE